MAGPYWVQEVSVAGGARIIGYAVCSASGEHIRFTLVDYPWKLAMQLAADWCADANAAFTNA